MGDEQAWASGLLAEFDPGESGEHWQLVCTGDWMPRDGHVEAMAADPVSFYGDLLPELAGADLRMVNVECVLGEAGEPIPKDGPNLRVAEHLVASLTSVPFDIACLANNHTADFGEPGLRRTIDVLETAGLRTVGAGSTGDEAAQPLTVPVRGVEVTVVNCGEGEECRSIDGGPGVHGLDLITLEDQIQSEKEAGRVVVVVFHGGREHVPVPPPYVVRDLRAIARMGADVVLGHHPHVPQGFEVHHGVPIAYSLGNFAFWFDTERFFHHVGYAVQIDFIDTAVRTVRAVPYLIEQHGLRRLTGPARERFNRAMAAASAVLTDDAAITDAWNAAVDHYANPDEVRKWMLRGADTLAADDRHRVGGLANRFLTPAHTELLSRGLFRHAHGVRGTASEAARSLLNQYLN